MDRNNAEWLPSSDARHAADTSAPLAHLLALAAAPSQPHELVGEEAAVAAFRRSDPAPARGSGRRALLAKLLTVKVTAALAVTAVGGVAVAAATGALPEVPVASGISPRATPPVAPPPPPATRPAPGRPTHTASPSTTPATPSLADLCRAAAADPDLRLDNPIYAPLVAAAGGREKPKVRGFCAPLLPEPTATSRERESDTSAEPKIRKLRPSKPPRSPRPSHRRDFGDPRPRTSGSGTMPPS